MAKRKNSLLAASAYIVFFFPLLAGKKDEFTKYHTRQGTWLLVVALALQGVLSLWVGWGLPLWVLLRGLIRVFLLVMVTSGILTAMRGEEKELPVIGKFAPKFF